MTTKPPSTAHLLWPRALTDWWGAKFGRFAALASLSVLGRKLGSNTPGMLADVRDTIGDLADDVLAPEMLGLETECARVHGFVDLTGEVVAASGDDRLDAGVGGDQVDVADLGAFPIASPGPPGEDLLDLFQEVLVASEERWRIGFVRFPDQLVEVGRLHPDVAYLVEVLLVDVGSDRHCEQRAVESAGAGAGDDVHHRPCFGEAQ